MKIEYYGHSCFKITATDGTSVLTDPFGNIGYELPENLSADIVASSHAHYDHDCFSAVNARRVVTGAGCFSFGNVKITGIESKHDNVGGTLRGDNTIYLIETDGLTLCHMGDLGEENVEDVCSRLCKSIDVLFVPIGGTYTIDGKTAKRYADAIMPKLTIPMHFKTSDLAISVSDERTFVSLLEKPPVRLDGEVNRAETFFGERSVLILTRKKR